MQRFGNDNYKLYHPIYKEIAKKGTGQQGQAYLTANELLLYAGHLKKDKENPTPRPINGGSSTFKPNNNGPLPFIPPYIPPQNNSSYIPPQNNSGFKPNISFNYR
jgi:hypothetical protein